MKNYIKPATATATTRLQTGINDVWNQSSPNPDYTKTNGGWDGYDADESDTW